MCWQIKAGVSRTGPGPIATTDSTVLSAQWKRTHLPGSFVKHLANMLANLTTIVCDRTGENF